MTLPKPASTDDVLKAAQDGIDWDWCVSLGGAPREDFDPLINDNRNWTVPGCFTWYRKDSISLVNGSC